MILQHSFNPYFYNEDDYYVNPYAGYYRRQQQIARQRELEEMERRRRLAEEEEARLRYIQILQERERKRRLRMKRAEQMRLQPMRQRYNEEEEQTPQYEILQGPDGRFYYRILDDYNRTASKNRRNKRSEFSEGNLVVGNEGRSRIYSCESNLDQPHQMKIDRMRRKDFMPSSRRPSEGQWIGPVEDYNLKPDLTKTSNMGTPSSSRDSSSNTLHTKSDIRKPINRSLSLPRTKNPSRKISHASNSILIGCVEDASDDESDDFSKSVWRNRRPSEGQWIEPVDDYDLM